MTIIEHIENWNRNIFLLSAILGISDGVSYWLFLLIFIWLALYTVINYLKLTQRNCFKFGVLMEIFTMFTLFTFFLFNKYLIIWLAATLILVANLLIVFLYWYYEKYILDEER